MITVIGIDPSSKKLAAVSSVVGDEPNAQIHTKPLPADKPTAALLAFEWARTLVELQSGEVYVFIELPVMGRGGPGSTIPQAIIHGALLAGAQMAEATVIQVNNARVKKEVIGHGNANKKDISEWVDKAWHGLYMQIGKDQDLCDAAMIYVHGRNVVARRNQFARKKNLKRVTIKRGGKVALRPR